MDLATLKAFPETPKVPETKADTYISAFPYTSPKEADLTGKVLLIFLDETPADNEKPYYMWSKTPIAKSKEPLPKYEVAYLEKGGAE
jgi:hypothetical protein